VSSSVRIVAGRDRGRARSISVSAPPFQRSVKRAAKASRSTLMMGLVEERPQQLFPVARRRRACVPDGDEIRSEREQAVTLLLANRMGASGLTTRKIGLCGLERLQACFPLSLETARDETVVGIDGAIAPFRSLGFVAGAFNGKSPLLERRLAIGFKPFRGGECRSQLCGF